jgi:hypothetical protein
MTKAPFRYVPGEMVNKETQPLPLTVSIDYLEDARGTSNCDYVILATLPLVPYVESHYDRPELPSKFATRYFTPREDLAKALMEEIRQNKLFDKVVLREQNFLRNADLVITGKILKTRVNTTVTLYGMSLFGVVPWLLGLPQGKVQNELDVRYEMRRASDKAVVWEHEVSGAWSSIFGAYYNQNDDAPYTGFGIILRKGLREGISKMAAAMKDNPAAFTK